MELGNANTLYLFCGRRCDRIKALLHEPTGFVFYIKDWM
ncbi:MAG: transposase [Roseburia sp.]|nr:transposase [Roseburia sp.]